MEDPKFSEEVKKMEYEPILPIERKLVAWSIGLGVVMLAILIAVSRWF